MAIPAVSLWPAFPCLGSDISRLFIDQRHRVLVGMLKEPGTYWQRQRLLKYVSGGIQFAEFVILKSIGDLSAICVKGIQGYVDSFTC